MFSDVFTEENNTIISTRLNICHGPNEDKLHITELMNWTSEKKIQDNLSPEKHIDRIFSDTFRMLRNIRMAFRFLDKDIMRKTVTSIIRQKLDYVEVIWSPHKKIHVLKLERIQKIATKVVPTMINLTNEERFLKMQLTH